MSSDSDSDISIVSQPNPIPVHVSQRPYSRKTKPNVNLKDRNNVKILRSNKIIQALDLPVVLNVNPRSIYNKKSQFHTLVTEHEIDLVCMSESWERENLTLDQIIQLEDHCVISNVHQRRGIGGRPAIIVNNKKYNVQNLTQTMVSIPWGVEAVWCLVSPKEMSNDSIVKKIAVASIYSKPDSRKKSVLLDHISETYNMLCSKYNVQ